MLTPQQVIDTYYLESRFDLLEIAAMLDRHDFATERTGAPANDTAKLDCLRNALAMMADPAPSTDRAERLLHLFATV
jgi:hypothetical protein